eukprot:GILK01007005.1.p1 GENE.GILK01007005.1~~GILK01007005.1.p1  ORF type:complete len:201 (+),score=26.18 GILK01007005.1:280-882(+)
MQQRKGKYERVATEEHEDGEIRAEDERMAERERRKKIWVDRLNWMSVKAHASFWVVAASSVIYYTNFFRVIWEHPNVNYLFFRLGLMGLGINIAIIFYLSIYLPYIARVEEEWDIYCPRVIPVATVVGISNSICFSVALWPVWGWVTLIILAVLFMGLMMTAHFLPSGFLGTVLISAIFFGASYTVHIIPHEGLWHKNAI